MLSGVFSIQEKSILFELRLVSLITKFVSPNNDPDFGRSWIPNNFENSKKFFLSVLIPDVTLPPIS